MQQSGAAVTVDLYDWNRVVYTEGNINFGFNIRIFMLLVMFAITLLVKTWPYPYQRVVLKNEYNNQTAKGGA